MRIAIYNPATMAFNVATPEEHPLGGMASCMCYLARALAGRGHQVTLISMLPPGTPQMLMGIEHLSTAPVLADAINFFRAKDYDAVIAVNYPDIASYVAMGSPKSFNVAWLHIYPDQPALAPLNATQGWLDAAVCVSATLRDAFHLRIPVVAIDNAESAHQRSAVLIHLVANGEQSGALAPMLERAAAELEREAERRLTWVAALLQPALIVLMGAIVLVLVLAVMLPIVTMNQLIR